MVPYQGAKSKHAGFIAQRLIDNNHSHYYDLCCGTGAVSLALARRGVNPRNITMVDSGPWGIFWSSRFDDGIFREYCLNVPNPLTKEWLKLMFEQPIDDHFCYRYPLLQAAAWGGTPLPIVKGRLRSRGYRKSINVSKIYNNVKSARLLLSGVRAHCCDVKTITIVPDSTVFCDPPYDSSYQDELRISDLVKITKTFYCTFSIELSLDSVRLHTSGKGGVNGNRDFITPEYLSKVTV